MRISTALNLALMAAGAAASVRTLQRRHRWEQANRRACIVLDHDDAQAVITRCGMPLAEFLAEARRHGATHLSLPELTLKRLTREARLAPVVPERPLAQPPPVGHWRYLAGAEADLVEYVAHELAARVPTSHACLVPDAPVPTLAVAGDVPTLSELGLGFDARVAAAIVLSGLQLVPRPVSYSWPEDRLIHRSLIQVVGLGARIVAFEGDLILGHEMHLEATLSGMERLGLQFAYFCETRHQKGDWFLAKRLAPKGQVVLAHSFSPQALVPEDYHSAAHHWGMLARMRGIRLCYVNVFRHIHATDPLECLHYLAHIREELLAQGLTFEGPPSPPLAAPSRMTLAISGLASAGAAALAASNVLEAREPLALAFTAASAAGALTLPYLDRPRGPLEEAYQPSYAPKLLALIGTASAPSVAASAESVLSAALVQGGMAASLAALTTGQEYAQRVEAYRSLNLDLLMPLAGTVLPHVHDARLKALALAVLGLGWVTLQRLTPDWLGELDRDLPAGHTHHLSAAQRAVGDALIALGPRPARKWAGLGLGGLGLARLLREAGHPQPAAAASLAATVGNVFMLAAFRQPERPLAATVPLVARSWAAGAGIAAAIGLINRLFRK